MYPKFHFAPGTFRKTDTEICKTIEETTRSFNRARKRSRYVNEIFVRLISASIGRKGARVQPPSPQENDTETSSPVSERRGNRDSIEWQMRREIERIGGTIVWRKRRPVKGNSGEREEKSRGRRVDWQLQTEIEAPGARIERQVRSIAGQTEREEKIKSNEELRAKRTADRSTRHVATCQFMAASQISHSIAERIDIEITRIIAPPVCRWFRSLVKQTVPLDLSAATRFGGKESPFKKGSIISRLRNQMVKSIGGTGSD